jgi:ribonuclease D
MFIDKQPELDKLLPKLKKAKFICLDTEFMRERSFYPILCLIQLNIDGKNYAIDPMAGLDIKPLLKIINSTKLVIIHSGRQDLEIIYLLTGKLPKKIFDTQIAAMVCGFGEQVGYRELVKRICDEEIDKGERFTDWSRRPLSEAQVKYALADVEYLPEIYEKLSSQLKKEKRGAWLEAEEESLVDPKNYEENADEAWEKIKHRDKKYCHLGVLKEIAKWRDLKAREVDKPRRWVMKDEIVMEIALRKPASESDIKHLRGSHGVMDKYIPEVLEAVEKGLKTSKTKMPKLAPKKERNVDSSAIDLLKILLKNRAAENNVVPRLVAEAEDIEKFLEGEKVPFNKGWRHEVFGKYAEEFVKGKLKFFMQNGKLKIG